MRKMKAASVSCDIRADVGLRLVMVQVKNVAGKWADVTLADDEVAVVFGAVAHHVSGGLFQPASYRVVRCPEAAL